MQELIQIFCATLGTLGFALLFRVRREHLLFATLGGALSWTAYLPRHWPKPRPGKRRRRFEKKPLESGHEEKNLFGYGKAVKAVYNRKQVKYL